jgi:hypothetical protein
VTIAALFVETGGSYYGLPGVDPWDQERDARKYAGPHPVVAHPPCQRWGKLWAGQPLWIKRTGERKVKGDDDGCFASALASVREWGGVLEHPWGSHAWPHFELRTPPRAGQWVAADMFGYVPPGHRGGWTCCVEQGRYGHYARKPTLLLVYGLEFGELPDLRWGISEPSFPPEAIEKHGLAYWGTRLQRRRQGQLAPHRDTTGIPGPFDQHRAARRRRCCLNTRLVA